MDIVSKKYQKVTGVNKTSKKNISKHCCGIYKHIENMMKFVFIWRNFIFYLFFFK